MSLETHQSHELPTKKKKQYTTGWKHIFTWILDQVQNTDVHCQVSQNVRGTAATTYEEHESGRVSRKMAQWTPNIRQRLSKIRFTLQWTHQPLYTIQTRSVWKRSPVRQIDNRHRHSVWEGSRLQQDIIHEVRYIRGGTHTLKKNQRDSRKEVRVWD